MKQFVFCDGGQMSANLKGIGSVIGGTWAVVVAHGDRFTNCEEVKTYSGIILPNSSSCPMPGVTNNYSEVFALATAIGATQGDITLCSDSLVALRAWTSIEKWLRELDNPTSPHKIDLTKHTSRIADIQKFVPHILFNYLVKLASKGRNIKTMHLKGHPTKVDLERGALITGELVSIHNKRCDDLCNAEKKKYLAKLADDKKKAEEARNEL